MTTRSYGRSADQPRPITIEPGFVRTASGSALISVGETRVRLWKSALGVATRAWWAATCVNGIRPVTSPAA